MFLPYHFFPEMSENVLYSLVGASHATSIVSTRVEKLMQNAGIIRNRAKIEATINNAKRFLEVQKEFGSFCAYLWGFVGGKPRHMRRGPRAKLPATSNESDALALEVFVTGGRRGVRPDLGGPARGLFTLHEFLEGC
jgi:hypothetical protein